MGACRSLDAGTFNLIAASRGEKDEIKYKKEVNAFLEISLESRYTFNMLKKAGVPLVEQENVAYIVGDSAIEIARAHRKLELKRPMKDGCLNAGEKDAFRLLRIMIHSLLGEVPEDKTTVYFTVPANAANTKTDADYHQKVLEDIFKLYNVKGKTVRAFPINEALALVFAELGHKMFSGIGVSYGAGMSNFCYSIFSQPIATFALVNSGDWIDQQAALATNEPIAVINREKMKVDLGKTPTSPVERAIHAQYRIMVEKSVSGMKEAILKTGNDLKPDDPVDFILGGGTVSPPHFVEMFTEIIKNSDFPLPVGEIKRPEDHLFSVAKGALIAAENAQ